MKPVDFAEANVQIAEHQDEYLTLPSHVDDEGVVTSHWQPSPEELERLQQGGRVVLTVHTFSNPLQPVMLGVSDPIDGGAS